MKLLFAVIICWAQVTNAAATTDTALSCYDNGEPICQRFHKVVNESCSGDPCTHDECCLPQCSADLLQSDNCAEGQYLSDRGFHPVLLEETTCCVNCPYGQFQNETLHNETVCKQQPTLDIPPPLNKVLEVLEVPGATTEKPECFAPAMGDESDYFCLPGYYFGYGLSPLDEMSIKFIPCCFINPGGTSSGKEGIQNCPVAWGQVGIRTIECPVPDGGPGGNINKYSISVPSGESSQYCANMAASKNISVVQILQPNDSEDSFEPVEVCYECPPFTYNDEAEGANYCRQCVPLPDNRVECDPLRDWWQSCSEPGHGFENVDLTDPNWPRRMFDRNQYKCQPCAKGKYQRQQNHTNPCKECPTGWFQDQTGADQCKECPYGKTSDSGALQCTASGTTCNQGKYLHLTTCIICDPGRFQDTGGHTDTSCKVCSPGKVQENSQASTCSNCIAGQYQNENDQAECKNCGPGQFQVNAKQTLCQNCENGQYQDQSTQTECIPCTKGRANSNQGSISASNCSICTSGKHSNNQTGQTTCTDCPRGQFNAHDNTNAINHDNADDCVGCASGKYSGNEGSINCVNCTAGRASNGEGKRNCIDCNEGFYMDQVGQSICKSCPDGKAGVSYVVVRNSSGTACANCVAGYYVASDKEGCDACPYGKHNSEVGSLNSTFCKSCPEGQDTKGRSGQPSCENCPKGRYRSAYLVAQGAKSCIECKGNVTNFLHCAGCPAGYFGEISNCVGCPIGRYAVGGNKKNCTSCPKGFYTNNIEFNFECTPCQQGKYSITESAPSNSTCIHCTAGKYSNVLGKYDDQCNGCPQGKWSNIVGAGADSFCIACLPGQFSQVPSRSTPCDNCTQGKFKFESASKKECERCPSGYYQKMGRQSFCKTCSPGLYQNDEGKEKCKDCEIGRSQNSIANNTCVNCPMGYYQNERGQPICLQCISGQYSTGNGHSDKLKCEKCEQGQYQDNSGKGDCLDCPIGWSQDVGGQARCNECSRGKYQNEENQLDCKTCGTNNYTKEVGRTVCKACGKDRISPPGTDRTRCVNCPAGYAGENCRECDAGKYRDLNQDGILVQLDECKTCDEGQYQEEKGKLLCLSCVPGKYQNEKGETRCINCDTGQYQKDSNQTTCKTCTNGQYSTEYSNEAGSASCQTCPPGKQGNARGGCASCAKGTFRTANDSITNPTSSCTNCPTGYYTDEFAKSDCIKCGLGRFANETGQPQCRKCTTGLYQNEIGSATCKRCDGDDEGKRPNALATACENPEWKIPSDCKQTEEYLNSTGLILNEASTWNTSRCIPCPSGSICNLQSETGKNDTLDTNASYWRVPYVYYETTSDKRETFEFIKCPFKGRCNGDSGKTLTFKADPSRNTTEYDTCSNGTNLNFPLCAVCASKWTKQGLGPCIPCTAGVVLQKWALVFFCVCTTMGLMVYCRKKFKKTMKKLRLLWLDLLRVAAILVTFCQISSSVPGVVQIEWPENFLTFVDSMSVVQFDFFDMTGLGCGIDINHANRLVIAALSPIVLLSCAAASSFVAKKSLRKKLKVAGNENKLLPLWIAALSSTFDLIDVDASGELDVDELSRILDVVHTRHSTSPTNIDPTKRSRQQNPKKLRRQDSRRTLKQWDTDNSGTLSKEEFLIEMQKDVRFSDPIKCRSSQIQLIMFARGTTIRAYRFGTAFNLLFMIHSPISQTAFRWLDCRRVGDRRFLHSDYSIECFTDIHNSYLPLAILMIVVYSIGIPLVLGLYLFKHRQTLRTPLLVSRVGWLYSRYNVGVEWWDLHEIVRKLLLIGVLLLFPNPTLQLPIAIVICLFGLVNLNLFQPNCNQIVFRVGELAFCATTIKYVGGLQVRAMANEPAELQDMVGWVLISIDSFVLCAAFGATVLLIRNLLIHAATADSLDELDDIDRLVMPTTNKKSDVVPSSKLPTLPVDDEEHDTTGLRDWNVEDDDDI